MGIITLFHAVFQVRHINSHIRYGHINIHRCVYVRTVWLSGEKLLFHKPGRARSDRLCTTFFCTLFSSPLLSFQSLRLHLYLSPSPISLSISSYFLMFSLLLFHFFLSSVLTVCFFPLLSILSAYFPFMVSVILPP